MMRFDPTKWVEVDLGVITRHEAGAIRLACSERCALYVKTSDVETEVLVGAAYSFDVDLIGSSHVEFVVDGPSSARVFMYAEKAVTRASRHGLFTNPDRAEMGMASDAYAAVAAAMRRFKLEQMEKDRVAAARLRAHRADRQAAEPVADVPAADYEPPEPAPDPE